MNRSKATALVVVPATLVLRRLSRGAWYWGDGFWERRKCCRRKEQKGVQGRNAGLSRMGGRILNFTWRHMVTELCRSDERERASDRQISLHQDKQVWTADFLTLDRNPYDEQIQTTFIFTYFSCVVVTHGQPICFFYTCNIM